MRPKRNSPGPPEQRERTAMLRRVRHHHWGESELHPSPDRPPQIELGLTRRSDAAKRRQLPPGTTVSQVFATAGERLLILGAPGSGKTIALSALLRDLLDQAEQDPKKEPIPVLLNLSSWAQRWRPLTDWLVDELAHVYDVPRWIAQDWIDGDVILPLLDGLDEVAPEARAGCVAAVNDFLDDYFGGLAVCSRTKDYDESVGTPLRLREAVELQPPTRQQVREYLEGVGAPLDDVRAALDADDSLWELVQSPLMLDIVARTYQGRAPDGLRVTGAPRQRRARLFTEYISEMFARRPIAAGYTEAQARHWLAWLARSMRDHSQSELHLDRLQPDWLPSTTQRRRVITLAAVAVGPVFGLATGLALGLILGLIAELAGLTGGMANGLLIGSICGVVYAVAWGWVAAGNGAAYGRLLRSWNGLKWSWSGLAVGLVVGSAVGLTFRAVNAGIGMAIGLFASASAMVFVAHMGDQLSGKEATAQARTLFKRAEELPWPRTGSAVGLIAGLTVWLGGGVTVGWGFGSVFGLLAAIVGAQFTVRLGGGRAHGVAPTERGGAFPRSRTRLIVGLVSCLAAGLGAGLSIGQAGDLTAGLMVGLLVGLPAALLAAFASGGSPRRAASQSTEDASALIGWGEGVSGRFLRLAAGLFVGLLFGLPVAGAFNGAVGLIGGLVSGLLLGAGGFAAASLSPHGGPAVARTIGLIYGLAGVVSFGLLGGVIAGLLLGMVSGLLVADGHASALDRMYSQPNGARAVIEPIEELHWSWPGLGFGLFFGLLMGLGLGLASGQLVVGLMAAMSLGLALGAAGGLSVELADQRATPNQGIHRSARHSLEMGLIGSLVLGLPIGGLLFGLFGALYAGLLAGPFIGLRFGGTACLRHVALRALLVRNGVAPWRYVRFLNDMADRTLLRRSGGGYQFFHRLLLDHFAGERSPTAQRLPWPAPPDDLDRPGR